jgi:hypothetical protein
MAPAFKEGMMSRVSLALAPLLAAASAAYAQEAITQPLPRSEITIGKSFLEGAFIWGENDEAEATFVGLSGQLMIPIAPRIAFNAKISWITDKEAGVDIDVTSIGGSVAYELIEPAVGTPALTIFGGLGVSFIEISAGGMELADDTDLYVELGIQADLKLSDDAVFIPFFGVTFVFNGDSDTILGIGGKIQLGLGGGWSFTGAAVFQFDDISEAWLLLIGVTKEIGT